MSVALASHSPFCLTTPQLLLGKSLSSCNLNLETNRTRMENIWSRFSSKRFYTCSWYLDSKAAEDWFFNFSSHSVIYTVSFQLFFCSKLFSDLQS